MIMMLKCSFQDRPCMPVMWTFRHCSLMTNQVVMIVMRNLLSPNFCWIWWLFCDATQPVHLKILMKFYLVMENMIPIIEFWFLKKWKKWNMLLNCIIAKISFSLKDLVNMTYVNSKYQDFLDPR